MVESLPFAVIDRKSPHFHGRKYPAQWPNPDPTKEHGNDPGAPIRGKRIRCGSTLFEFLLPDARLLLRGSRKRLEHRAFLSVRLHGSHDSVEPG
jgi:hypothetical protein